MEDIEKKKTPYTDFTLLIDGKNAFPEIIRCIESAKKTIRINMFIWRDDSIGNKIAQAVLEAADRGVKVEISVDRYGVILEKAEEAKKSFFHKRQTFMEKLKIKTLELIYPMHGTPRKGEDEYTQLYKQLINHPSVIVQKDVFKADHSKFYIIDGEILILGGVNIEDKENGADMQGRVYQDYMVKITGKAYVDAFLFKLQKGKNISEDYTFWINAKGDNVHLFEMKERYLEMIYGAKTRLMITMAYFSPLKEFVNAIVNAWARGVQVTVMVPQSANYQNDTNRKTVRKLLKKTKNGITVYFSPKMVHTKMIVSDSLISFGSTNITKKAFKQLSELNLTVKNTPSEFTNRLLESVEENYRLSQKISSYKEVQYNRVIAFFEGFLV